MEQVAQQQQISQTLCIKSGLFSNLAETLNIKWKGVRNKHLFINDENMIWRKLKTSTIVHPLNVIKLTNLEIWLPTTFHVNKTFEKLLTRSQIWDLASTLFKVSTQMEEVVLQLGLSIQA